MLVAYVPCYLNYSIAFISHRLVQYPARLISVMIRNHFFLLSTLLEYLLSQNLHAQKFFPLYKGENDPKIAVSSHSLPVSRVLHLTCPKAFSVASLTALK